MYFYDQLRDLRKHRGFTVRELSERSGVSHAYISQLESGKRRIPSPDVLAKLSKGLNIPYAELMRVAGYLEPPTREEPTSEAGSRPVHLRAFLRDNELMFDDVVLTELDKEWIERMLTVMFWRKSSAAGLSEE
ncbi:helix-turn-helix transcriptional regulator [Paenibacillus athensensis]|uniref:Transcriptional regulator n=1 Tax=Paenibacillus athensensis TaxID=1967502 RepID=A0A4Y8PV97_9BACL|nr:helix-turn-helix transcriptional regulator [Paenibacillus athensensis]MCD1261826.1 helix-turn-helix transcriptional regulator [Paenibacillus athensensis]